MQWCIVLYYIKYRISTVKTDNDISLKIQLELIKTTDKFNNIFFTLSQLDCSLSSFWEHRRCCFVSVEWGHNPLVTTHPHGSLWLVLYSDAHSRMKEGCFSILQRISNNPFPGDAHSRMKVGCFSLLQGISNNPFPGMVFSDNDWEKHASFNRALTK